MTGYAVVGKRIPPRDSVSKVTGQAKYGAEEGGEGTAPTIANAIYDAVGVRITSLPITSEKVLKALPGALRSRGPQGRGKSSSG